MKRTLIVMVKEPRAGRVKTRLGREIGMVAAAWWFRHQVRRLLRRIEDPRWRVVLAVAPDRAGVLSRVLPAHLARWPQGKGDLGVRMARMLRQARGGPACVIGADIPGVTRPRIAEAFDALGSHNAVFGPAPDGGYWLIGLKHPAMQPPEFLHTVRWSTDHALTDSIATLKGHRIARVATLRDVDSAADLK
ncbi:TIGR04282 family arsenosugar biosynthesis glycosyltransferase [uncultured Sulfitobacter sp.]|uniref:TIGR04282 family arsenosugar biosynthesis glycosyltransferase n=1 Tax=uncultured Sulfitobacter sp. TaxID=191468 RepID=UPI00263159AB|nr:TIGR04282 family arsenosugar biosynthesis glycosyltransferase [uncultured Sulfitobacter sp.]